MRFAGHMLSVFFVMLLWLPSTNSLAQDHDQILRGDINQRVFYVQCQGSVNASMTFTGVRLQVVVTHTPVGSLNPVRVVIQSMPVLGLRNSLYWHSDETRMEVLGDILRCSLANPGTHVSTLHFFYMSPALYATKQGPALRDHERTKWVDAHSRPIKIIAQQGELSMRFGADSVSGSIVLAGQDELAHKPVRYVATFQGQEFVYAPPGRLPGK